MVVIFNHHLKHLNFSKIFGKKAGAIYVIIIAVIALFIFKPFVIIESGQVGIKATTGKYDETPLNPGFHLYVPCSSKSYNS